MKMYYRFTATDNVAAPEVYNDDYILSKFEKNQIIFNYDLIRYGYLKSGGWLYDFTDILKRYVVKQEGHWGEYYAPNKTLLRKNLKWGGQIERILEY